MEGTTALAVKGAPSATSNGHSIPIRAIPRIRSISLTCCEKRMGLCALSMTRMSLASFYARRGSGCFVKPDLNRAPSRIPGAVKCSFARRITSDVHSCKGGLSPPAVSRFRHCGRSQTAQTALQLQHPGMLTVADHQRVLARGIALAGNLNVVNGIRLGNQLIVRPQLFIDEFLSRVVYV